MSGIFISYRRDDTRGYTGRLAADLKQRLGENSIFHDIDQIDPGADFVDAIQDALNGCQLVLAVIGPGWETATDKKGRRRLDNPQDFVVVELKAALDHKIRIIPVLVGGAEMPDAEQFPDQIRPLARRQAHELSDIRWRYDLDTLVAKIKLVISMQNGAPVSSELTSHPASEAYDPSTQGGSTPAKVQARAATPPSKSNVTGHQPAGTQPGASQQTDSFTAQSHRADKVAEPPRLQAIYEIMLRPRVAAAATGLLIVVALTYFTIVSRDKPVPGKDTSVSATSDVATPITNGMGTPKPDTSSIGTPSPIAESPISVKIAHAGPLSGSIANLGKDDENGVRLAIDQTNAKRVKIDGKVLKIEFISEDDKADPKTGTMVAQKLVDAKVIAVIGHLHSSVTIPASEIYNMAGIPVISGSATNPTLTERGLKTVFRTIGRDDEQGPQLATYIAKELKGKKVALIDDKTAYGEGLANEVEKTLKANGINPITRERTTDKEIDFKAILIKIKAKSPDVVFYGGLDATAGPMLKQARELGIEAVFVFGDGACTNDMAKLAGDAAEGFVCSQIGQPPKNASTEFLGAFNARYGEVKQYAPYFYDATLAIVEAIKKANSVDPAKFVPELFNVSFTGATGKVAFDAKGDRSEAAITIFKMYRGKITPTSIFIDVKAR